MHVTKRKKIVKWVEKFREVDREKIVKAARNSLYSEAGKEAFNYLKDTRKFSDAIIDKFCVGYCPLHTNHQLKGRLITPIYDSYGNLLAVSTRHLSENHSNRFWHESFDKGSYLYGLYQSKREITKYQKAILVEGEFDVLSLHSFGFSIAIAVCGGAFTLSQISLLSRYCSDIYIVFDGDIAGIKFTERVLKDYEKYNIKYYGINFIPVSLPNGLDPNKYLIDYGKESLKKILRNAKK